MPFAKGKTNNPNGRPSDPNVSRLREKLRGALVDETRIKKLFDELDKLLGRDYIDCFLKIHKEIVPPLASSLEEIGLGKDAISIFEYIRKREKEMQEGLNNKAS